MYQRRLIMREAGKLDLELPMQLPGIKIKTAPDRFSAIHEMQLERFNGKTWEHFGGLIGLE